jgi:hypothetical protein
MTNIVTNADGSIAVNLPVRVEEHFLSVWIPGVILIALITTLLVWMVVRKEEKK